MDRVCRLEDDAKVVACASHGPEEVRVLGVGGLDNITGCVDNLVRDYLIGSQAMESLKAPNASTNSCTGGAYTCTASCHCSTRYQFR